MPKTIVMHMSVDLDAVSSAWLLKRFRPGWENANLAFVPAGTTFENKPVDSDPDIAHVDTGLGLFDHHQFRDNKLSATKRVFTYLDGKKYVPDKVRDAVARMVEFVTLIDNFGEVSFHDPTADQYDFTLHQVIEGFKTLNIKDPQVCELMFAMLDATLEVFKRKVLAEKEIKDGFIFQSKWGKALAIETRNEEILKYALKLGYKVVIRKDPQRGFIRIKTQPQKDIDLTPVYEEIKKIDKTGSWFFHISRHMLLNGSSKNPAATATSLTLKNVIEIIRKI